MKKKVIVFGSPLHTKWESPKIEEVFTIPNQSDSIQLLMPRLMVNWNTEIQSPLDTINDSDLASHTFNVLQNGQSMFENHAVIVYAFLIDRNLVRTTVAPNPDTFILTDEEKRLVLQNKAPLRSIFGVNWNLKEYNKLGVFELPVEGIEVLGCMWHQCYATNNFSDALFLNDKVNPDPFLNIIKQRSQKYDTLEEFYNIPRKTGTFTFYNTMHMQNRLCFFKSEHKGVDAFVHFENPQYTSGN